MECFNRKGFTMSELLLAITISMILLAVVITFYIMTNKLWAYGNAKANLQRKARGTVERMVRGVNGFNGLREATTIDSPAVGFSQDSVMFSDTLGSSRSFYLSGGPDGNKATFLDNQLRYIDDAGNDTVILDNYISSLSFNTISSDSIDINIGLQDTVRGQTVDINLYTHVTLRN